MADGDETVLPSWLSSLKGLAEGIQEQGSARGYIFARVAEFTVALVIGTTTGIAERIGSSLGAVADSFRFAGSGLISGFGAAGDAILWIVNSVFGALASAADIMGPLGPLVYLATAALVAAFVWRLTRAILDSVPVLSGIQTFLEGG